MPRTPPFIHQRWFLLLIAMAGAVWCASRPLAEAFFPPDLSVNWRTDADAILIHKGLSDAVTFRDTLSWWTGTWVGQVPFWRPLTSYGYWAMYKAFGFEHQDAWLVVHALSHLLTCALMFLLIEAVTGSAGIAAAAVLMFNVWVPDTSPAEVGIPLSRAAIRAVGHWKTCPDLWCAGAMVLALLFAWKKRLIPATIAAAVSAGFKEFGFLAFPLLMLFYWYRHRELPRGFIAVVAVAAALVLVKMSAVGVGYSMGSNHAWATRTFRAVCGYPLNVFVSGHSPSAVLGVGIAVAFLARRRAGIRYGALIASLLCAWVVERTILTNSLGELVTWETSFITLFVAAGRTEEVLRSALWIVFAWYGLHSALAGRVLVLIAGYIFLCLPYALAPQVLQHAYYTPWILSCGAKAICLWATVSAVLGVRNVASPARRRAAA